MDHALLMAQTYLHFFSRRSPQALPANVIFGRMYRQPRREFGTSRGYQTALGRVLSH